MRTIDSLVQKQFGKDQEYFEKELVDFDNEELIENEKLGLVKEKQTVPQWARKFEPLELTSSDFKENIPSIVKPPKLELK